ncbi:hypothetical protein L1987_37277 [Smallanthus sonchifolius]|uniref:Uncharacterized protein n=1 Tax=Smallanthus sonchifolius TaxID=185202 RepID=A0ACB9HFY5_9ASTR|nr:hypothetical protein L1987_37277 [Smallanthus sonchifolius]
MIEFLKKYKLDNIKEFDLVFFPMILSQHFYIICFNLKNPETIIIDNSALGEYNAKYNGISEKFQKEAFVSFIADFAHPKTDEMDDTMIKRFVMPWRTTENTNDCGIFMMRHMETYMGEEEKAWHCGFGLESENVQEKQIEDLRRKYCAKILLHEINELKYYIVEELKTYLQISYPSRKILEETSKKRIEERLKRELD